MRQLQPIPQALLGVLRLPFPHPRRAPERPHSRARGAARLGQQGEDAGEPGQDAAAVRHPAGAGADPEHAAQRRRQHRLTQPADRECTDAQDERRACRLS